MFLYLSYSSCIFIVLKMITIKLAFRHYIHMIFTRPYCKAGRVLEQSWSSQSVSQSVRTQLSKNFGLLDFHQTRDSQFKEIWSVGFSPDWGGVPRPGVPRPRVPRPGVPRSEILARPLINHHMQVKSMIRGRVWAKAGLWSCFVLFFKINWLKRTAD